MNPVGPTLGRRFESLAAGRHARRTRRVIARRDGVSRVDGRPAVDFSGNDYLGLSMHPAVVEAAVAAAREHGIGSTGSALVTGYSDRHAALEEALARFLDRDRALLFPSGYMANLGVAASLVDSGDRVFVDRLAHASIIDAARFSGGRWQRYPHADTGALERRLSRNPAAPAFVVTDGVFSMDGDVAPLAELARLTAAPEHMLIVDDAHGIGVMGRGGRGAVAAAGLDQDAVPLLVGTLGKAFGAAGAFVAGPAGMVEALLQEARTGLFTTAPAVPVVAAALAALPLVQDDDGARARLHATVAQFRELADDAGIGLSPSTTPIQPLVVGDGDATMAVTESLLERGLYVQGIRPPSVPTGAARLRITLSARHTPSQVETLVTALRDCLPAHCLQS